MLSLVGLLCASLIRGVTSDLGLINWGALTQDNSTVAGHTLYAGDVSCRRLYIFTSIWCLPRICAQDLRRANYV